MFCFSDHLFKLFFYPLIFISNQYFGSTTVTVCVHLTRATKNPSCALRGFAPSGVNRNAGHPNRSRSGVPHWLGVAITESLAKLCERWGVATTRNSGHPRDRSRSSGDHRIAREVVRTMGSSNHPKFAFICVTSQGILS